MLRKQSQLAHALIWAFFALYTISLALPALIFDGYGSFRYNPSEVEIVSLIEHGATCHRQDGDIRLGPDHKPTNSQGAKLTSLPPQNISCLEIVPRTHVYEGFFALMFGWLGLFVGNFAWCANVLALVAFVASVSGRAPKFAACFAAGALLVGLDALRFSGIPLLDLAPKGRFSHLGASFYVWEMSMAMLLLSQVVTIRQRRRLEQPIECPISGAKEH